MLVNDFNLRSEIPELGNYTIGSDFANIMTQLILDQKPRIIFELGSGVSTIFASYCLEKNGYGCIYSLDHLENYANETKNLVKRHQFKNIDVNIFHAPLKSYTIHNKNYQWYNLTEVNFKNKIDLLIIDGPPRPTNKLARYPALPLLSPYFSPEITILLDDAKRQDEKEITSLWLNEHPEFQSKIIDTEKGAVIFSKHG
jgi:hypothetical protein